MIDSFRGRHVLAEFHGVDREVCDDAATLMNALSDALTAAGATVCELTWKKFRPHGVTVVALLAESHASIHSYPEHGALFVDVFTCGDSADPERATRLLATALGATDTRVEVVVRGETTPRSPSEVVEPLGAGLSRTWTVSEVVMDARTPYQHLVIGRTAHGVTLFCDDERQSSEYSQLVYHEALLVPAVLLASRRARVLIIGSSEGVLSQLAVAAGAETVDHVDIDRDAVELCAEHLPYGYTVAELRRAESGSGPITVHYADGWQFVLDAAAARTCYDIVLIDLPDENDRAAQHNRLYTTEFLGHCRSLLAEGGVVGSQAGCPTLWRNESLLVARQRFGATFADVTYFGSDEHEWAFLFGSAERDGDAAARMIERLAELPLRPQTIDAATIRGGTVAPLSLRTRAAEPSGIPG